MLRAPLTPYFEGQHALLLNTTLLPRLWRDEIGRHELYHTHLWPTHLIDLHPMLWYPHEPFRTLHDLRYDQQHGSDGEGAMHLYPKYDYDRFGERLYQPYLRAIAAADGSVVPDRIVANSRYTAGYLSRVYNREVVDIVYPGAEPKTPYRLPRDPNLFVTVSQLWPHKRTRLLIEALALTDEAQLMIIGAGPDRDWLEALAGRLGVDDRVFFFTGLRNEELELILARAAGFLFAAIREPFGIVVLEAMAAGLPVIAVDEGGYTEVCTPETAFLVPAYPAAFAEKMALLRSDPQLRDRMGAAGRRAAAAYSWTRSADALEQLLVATVPEADAAALPGLDASRPLVGAQYYLWYGEGFGAAHWNDNPASGHVGDRPLLGYYGSTKGETIERHFAQFAAMGLDYVVLNLHVDARGVNQIELRAIEHLFELAEARDTKVRFAVQLVPFSDDVEGIATVLAGVRSRFTTRRHYLRLEGRPALFWFWTGAFDLDDAVLAGLARLTDGLTNLAIGLRLPSGTDEARLTKGLFAGFAPYSPLELADAESRLTVWNTAWSLAAEAGMRVRIATVSPGYDDSMLTDQRRTGNRRRQVPREDGATYRQMLDWVEALPQRPHLVLISTFNEFHENTHVEPTAGNGSLYIEMTRAFVDRLAAAAEERP